MKTIFDELNSKLGRTTFFGYFFISGSGVLKPEKLVFYGFN